jgi:hypothetical protein
MFFGAIHFKMAPCSEFTEVKVRGDCAASLAAAALVVAGEVALTEELFGLALAVGLVEGVGEAEFSA